MVVSTYPLHRLHPVVGRWPDRLDAAPDFHDEGPSGGPIGAVTAILHTCQNIRSSSLERVAARNT